MPFFQCNKILRNWRYFWIIHVVFLRLGKHQKTLKCTNSVHIHTRTFPHIHHFIYFCSFVFLQVREIGRSFAQAHFRLWWNERGHYQLEGRGGWINTFANVYIIYMRKDYAERLRFHTVISNELILHKNSFGSKCTKYYYSNNIFTG